MRKENVLFLIFIQYHHVFAQNAQNREIVFNPDEQWWVAITSLRHQTPYEVISGYGFDNWDDKPHIQLQSLLLGKWRYSWIVEPVICKFLKSKLTVTIGEGIYQSGIAEINLHSAFEDTTKILFPFNGKILNPLLFVHLQFNRWIELIYNQFKEYILRYLGDIFKNGYSQGVLFVIDNWEEDSGIRQFLPTGINDTKDQFVQESDIAVANLVTKKNRLGKVVLSRGTRKADDGKTNKGGNTMDVEAHWKD